MAAVYELLRLHTTPEKFLLEPLDTDNNELVIIDRVSQEISLQANEGQIPADAITKDIVGIFGIARLLAGPYLIVITKKDKVGEINGQTIWRVAGTEILSYKRTTMHLNEQQVQDNAKYLSILEYALNLQHYYFSTSYDVTHSVQRLNNTSPEFLQIPMHERADQRFVWNNYLLRDFAQQQELSRYCLPIMHGFIEIKDCTINGKTFSYVLISRRCCFRAGTRYYMRGLDPEGHAANYIETEQIVECAGNRCSYVQTRGSIPVYWSQRPNLKYKPTPVISQTQNHSDGFRRHFDAQIFNYGRQTLINLIDHKGAEDLLEKAFAQIVTNSQNMQIKYVSFDFHHECRKMRWDRLSILIDKLMKDIDDYGYFMVQQNGMVYTLQEGVFRTNCIDCLDRTNVVQSMIARKSLQNQFTVLEILRPGEKIENQAHFEWLFKNIWADNADACAKQYAGTGALKTDFTRTGKRTILGLLKDGVNASYRYFVNNFQDGQRQDSIDLLLGNYIVDEAEGISKPSPFRLERDWKFYALPVIFLVALSMTIISILIPDEHATEQFMYVLFWGTASVVTLSAVYFFGNEFVDRPRLAQAKFKTE